MKCSICNKTIIRSIYSTSQPICSSECHTDYFWNNKIIIKDEPTTVRINGIHYYIGSALQDMPSKYKGYCGQVFTIKFNDGRVVTTDNLSHNGEIPEKYREILPDNAVFVN